MLGIWKDMSATANIMYGYQRTIKGRHAGPSGRLL